MAGKTGLTKVEKVLDSVISSHIVQVQDLDLEVGDCIQGIDENMTAADECEVVSVTRYDTAYLNNDSCCSLSMSHHPPPHQNHCSLFTKAPAMGQYMETIQ